MEEVKESFNKFKVIQQVRELPQQIQHLGIFITASQTKNLIMPNPQNNVSNLDLKYDDLMAEYDHKLIPLRKKGGETPQNNGDRLKNNTQVITNEFLSKFAFKGIQSDLQCTISNCQIAEARRYYFNIIDYYGPGCKAVGDSKDWLAIVPDFIDGSFQMRYINLDKVAYDFARKANTITLIFNHASTAELEGYDERTAFQDTRFRYYQHDILGGEFELDQETKQKTGFKVDLTKVFIYEGESLPGISVLINLNFGLKKKRSVKTHEELIAHINLIREATINKEFSLEFLDMLPANSYKIYSDKSRLAFPVDIFKRNIKQGRNSSFEDDLRAALQNKRQFYLAKLVTLEKLDNVLVAEIVGDNSFEVIEEVQDPDHFKLSIWKNGVRREIFEDLSNREFQLEDFLNQKFMDIGFMDQKLVSNLELDQIINDYKLQTFQEESDNQYILDKKGHIAKLGVKIPDVGILQKFVTKSHIHKHSLYLCEPFNKDQIWRCKGALLNFKCFSGMDIIKEKPSPQNKMYTYVCINHCDTRFCEFCFKFYASVDMTTQIQDIIAANIRPHPKKLYKFLRTSNGDKYYFIDPQANQIGNQLFEISQVEDRYQFSHPQILSIDDRYLCLIGGSPKEKFDYNTSKLTVNKFDDDQDSIDAQQEIFTIVIVDTVKTTDTHSNKSASYNKIVYRMQMPQYSHHSACGLEWKKTLYVVGGELEGEWSPTGYAIALDGFKYKQIADILPVLKMASLAPVSTETISGFFIAGLVANEDDVKSAIQFYSSKLDSYSSIDKGDDDPYSYDAQGGFPAFKHFLFNERHYLLIAGGIGQNNKTSSNVQVISFIEKIMDNGEIGFLDLQVYGQYPLNEEGGDYFPHNQWVSCDDQSNDFNGTGTYMIVGAKGTYQFDVSIVGDKPNVQAQLFSMKFKMF